MRVPRPWGYLRRAVALCLALLLALQPCLVHAETGDETAKEDADAGDGAGIKIKLIESVLRDGRFDLKATWKLVTDPDMILGTIGGAAGFLVGSQLVSLFMPPGVGMFFRALPMFLLSSLGFEFGRGRGKLSHIDGPALLVQVLASAGGYAVFHTLLGAAAPTWALMIGATIFGVAANLITRAKPKDEPDQGAAAPLIPEVPAAGSATEASASPAAPGLAGQNVRDEYADLLSAIRADPTQALDQYQRYEAAQKALREAVASGVESR